MSFTRVVKSRGHKYKQLVKSVYDSEKKQSRIHVIKHLGKVVEDENGKEKLIKSPHKFDYIKQAYSVGKLALFWNVAEEFSIRDALIETIGSTNRANAILIMALNQLSGRKPLSRIKSWIGRTSLHRWMDLEASKYSKDYLLSSLDRVSFEDKNDWYSSSLDIQKKCVDNYQSVMGPRDSRLFFFNDVTRIRYNGKQNYWAENGYGAQTGRPHIGYGLIISRNNLMPVLSFPIRGSHIDTTTVQETVNGLKTFDFKEDITLVWDRGYPNNKNISYARNKGFHVLSGGSLTSNAVKDYLVKYSDAEIEKRSNVLRLSKKRGIYHKDWIGPLYGKRCKLSVSLDPDRRNRERLSRDLLIQELETAKSKKEIAYLKKLLHPIAKPKPGRRGYELDPKAEEWAHQSDGRSLFFCTDTSISGQEVIQVYSEREWIEKAFRLLKGSASLQPVRYQRPGRVEAYLSVVNFLAYEILAGIKWKIRENNIGMSLLELLKEASKIHEVEFIYRNKSEFQWTHMTKKVRNLFKPFAIEGLKHSY